MNGRSDPYYISFEVDWPSNTCPHCEQRTAIGHGWLFKVPRRHRQPWRIGSPSAKCTYTTLERTAWLWWSRRGRH